MINCLQNYEQRSSADRERGFSLTELMIALMVFTVIIGSVIALLVKSQSIFRTEQGVAEMDQNARLMIDFLTRDVQQSKENALGIGSKFRSIFSHNGPNGTADEMTIVSADVSTKIPAAALPLVAANRSAFSVNQKVVEIFPNDLGGLEAKDIINSIASGEQLIVSTVLDGGTVQFDIIKVTSSRVTDSGSILLGFVPTEYRGIQPEVPYGSTYEEGAFSMRPVEVKRYFIDRSKDPSHPEFALSIDNRTPIEIAKNIVAFQLRYLETKDGDSEGRWVKEQTLASEYRTDAVEVTLTARTQIEGDKQAERLVTLASVIRPRYQPEVGSPFGAISSGRRSPGEPFDGGTGGGFPAGSDGGDGDSFNGGGGSNGSGSGGSGSSGLGAGGLRHETKRIGPNGPRLGERLNKR